MTTQSKIRTHSQPPAPEDFGFGEDETLLRDLATRFLDDQIPVEKLRALLTQDPNSVYDNGHLPEWDEGLWKQIVELGWSGLAVSEADGGSGFSLVGIAGLVECVGRHALPSPLIATLNATLVLREAELDPAKVWMTRIAEGTSATLAITDAKGNWEDSDCDIEAREEDNHYVLDGSASFVQDAFKSELLVVHATVGSGSMLCVLPKNAPGITVEQDHIHDLTRDQATVRFEDVRISIDNIVSREGAATLRTSWPGLLIVVAADLCGGGEWLLQTTVEYAKNRKQFDRAIGFFQAVKHPLVNGMILVDRARSLVYSAACKVDIGADDAENAARMAKSAASDAGAFLSGRAVQLHGGIGLTWESDVHLFFKRSMHNQVLYGDGVFQRRRIADDLIGTIESTGVRRATAN